MRGIAGSVSSVDPLESLFDSASDAGEEDSTMDSIVGDVYERLRQLHMVHDRPRRRTVSLRAECDAYLDLEHNAQTTCDMDLLAFAGDQVLCVDVHNLSSSSSSDDSFMDKLKLKLSLYRRAARSAEFVLVSVTPNYCNNVYSLVATPADLQRCVCRLVISNASDETLALRVRFRISTAIRPQTLRPYTSVTDHVSLGQSCEYRILVPDPTQLLTVTVLELEEDAEVELLATDRHDGAVAPCRDDAVWRCIAGNPKVLHVHPDDPRRSRSSEVVLSVLGCRDIPSRFSIEACLSTPPSVRALAINVPHEFRLSCTNAAYFSLRVNPAAASSTVVVIGDLADASTVRLSDGPSTKVLARDELGALGLMPASSVPAPALGLRPVVYISCDDMYPSEHSFSWKGSAAEGALVVEVRSSEFSSDDRLTVYLSVVGFAVGALSDPPPLLTVQALTIAHAPIAKRLALYRDIYESIDGSTLSLADRAALPLDDPALTYYEVDVSSFATLLRESGARDGQVFCNLGCGKGTALAAALVCGVSFARVIGIELLPSLSKAAADSLDALCRLIPHAPQCEVRTADMLAADWKEADLTLLSSYCFSETMLQALLPKLRLLKSGATLLAFRLPDQWESSFDLVTRTRLQLSFGSVFVNVLRRNSHET